MDLATYICLRKGVTIGQINRKDVNRILWLIWAAYAKQSHNQCILPITGTIFKALKHGFSHFPKTKVKKMKINQWLIKRKWLEISVGNQKVNVWIREKPKLKMLQCFPWNENGLIKLFNINPKVDNSLEKYLGPIGCFQMKWRDDIRETVPKTSQMEKY